MTIDGSDRAVTPIINDSTVPRPAPFANRLSAIGMLPKMSAYIGMPMRVANGTEYQCSAQQLFDKRLRGRV